MGDVLIYRWIPVEQAEEAAALTTLGASWAVARPVHPDDLFPGRVTVQFCFAMDPSSGDVAAARAVLETNLSSALDAAGIANEPLRRGIFVGAGPVPLGMRSLPDPGPMTGFTVGRWISWGDTDRALAIPGLGTQRGTVVDPPPVANGDLALIAFVFQFRERLTAEMQSTFVSFIDTRLSEAGIEAEEYDGAVELPRFDPSPAGAHRRSTPLVIARILRVFPDWGHRWPLWETGTASYANTPELYGLSPEVTAGLRAWHDDWEQHFDIDTGWPDPVHEERSVTELRRLAAMITSEIGSWIRVQVR